LEEFQLKANTLLNENSPQAVKKHSSCKILENIERATNSLEIVLNSRIEEDNSNLFKLKTEGNTLIEDNNNYNKEHKNQLLIRIDANLIKEMLDNNKDDDNLETKSENEYEEPEKQKNQNNLSNINLKTKEKSNLLFIPNELTDFIPIEASKIPYI
jgi:hypothetical protein